MLDSPAKPQLGGEYLWTSFVFVESVSFEAAVLFIGPTVVSVHMWQDEV